MALNAGSQGAAAGATESPAPSSQAGRAESELLGVQSGPRISGANSSLRAAERGRTTLPVMPRRLGPGGCRKAVRSVRRSSPPLASPGAGSVTAPPTCESQFPAARPPRPGALPSGGPGPQSGRGGGGGVLRPGRGGRGRPGGSGGVSAPATAGGAMEPRESGKVGLEGPWGRPPPSRRSLTWAPARRAVRAEAPRMSQPCREGLARSPAAAPSALGRPSPGGGRREERTNPPRAPRGLPAPSVSRRRAALSAVGARLMPGRETAQCGGGKVPRTAPSGVSKRPSVF